MTNLASASTAPQAGGGFNRRQRRDMAARCQLKARQLGCPWKQLEMPVPAIRRRSVCQWAAPGCFVEPPVEICARQDVRQPADDSLRESSESRRPGRWGGMEMGLTRRRQDPGLKRLSGSGGYERHQYVGFVDDPSLGESLDQQIGKWV